VYVNDTGQQDGSHDEALFMFWSVYDSNLSQETNNPDFFRSFPQSIKVSAGVNGKVFPVLNYVGRL
jgi:hypothetical protein